MAAATVEPVPVVEAAPPDPTPAPAPRPATPPPAAPVATEPAAETTDEAGGDDLPTSTLLRKVQAQLSTTHPLLAQSLSRTCGIDLAGDSLVFRFPSSAGLFADRFKDPGVVTALRAACESALGRVVAARVEIDPNARAPQRVTKPKPAPEPVAPIAGSANGEPPAFLDDAPHPADGPQPAASSAPAASHGGQSAASGAPAATSSPAATSAPQPAATPVPSPSSESAAPRPARVPADPELRRHVENEPAVLNLLDELKGTVLSVEEI